VTSYPRDVIPFRHGVSSLPRTPLGAPGLEPALLYYCRVTEELAVDILLANAGATNTKMMLAL